MSIIAITHTGDSIHCLSDGRSASEATREVNSLDRPKVYKVSPSCCMFWLGYAPTNTSEQQLLDRIKGYGTVSAARKTEAFMNRYITPEWQAKLIGPDRFHTCVLIVGYQAPLSVIWQIDSENPDWTPEGHKLTKGNHAIMGYDKETSDLQRYEKNLEQLGDPKKAFTKTVRYFESIGKPVGGTIFMETIKPTTTNRQS